MSVLGPTGSQRCIDQYYNWHTMSFDVQWISMFTLLGHAQLRQFDPSDHVDGYLYAPDHPVDRDKLTDGISKALSGHPLAGKWWQHELDPRCSPDPTKTTVTVPSILANETAADYTQCVATLGLKTATTTLPDQQAEWSLPAGAVQSTSPAAGNTVNPGSTVNVVLNPDPMPDPTKSGEADYPECDRSPAGYVPQSQQAPSGFTPVSDPSLVASQTFDTTPAPTVLNYGHASVINTDPLDFGGWGYWHILAGHGWSLADDADTRVALEDPAPMPGTNENGVNPYEFYGPKYPGTGSVTCRRVVLVDFGTASGDPGPTGIITSFGADVMRLRPGLQ